MSAISVDVSADGLTGSLLVTGAGEEEYPDRNRLRSALERRGVMHGIRSEALDEMVAKKTPAMSSGLPSRPRATLQ